MIFQCTKNYTGHLGSLFIVNSNSGKSVHEQVLTTTFSDTSTWPRSQCCLPWGFVSRLTGTVNIYSEPPSISLWYNPCCSTTAQLGCYGAWMSNLSLQDLWLLMLRKIYYTWSTKGLEQFMQISYSWYFFFSLVDILVE